MALSGLSQQMYGDLDSVQLLPASENSQDGEAPISLGYASLHAWDPGFGSALEKDAYSIKFGGFVKADEYYSSRSFSELGITWSAREQAFCWIPIPPVYDSNGCDLTDKKRFNFIAMQTQLASLIRGPDVLNARVQAYVEGDFFGSWIIINRRGAVRQGRSLVNSLWLRHAFVQFDWDNVSLLMGQFWHPLLPRESASTETVFVSAQPFEAYSRNPQIRLTVAAGDHVEFIAAALSQVDFKTVGPELWNTRYLRNSPIPNLHGQMRLFCGENIFGVGVDFKQYAPREFVRLQPPLYNRVKAEQTFNGTSALAYAEFYHDDFDAKFKFIYGENLADQGMIGGYGTTCFNVIPNTSPTNLCPDAQVPGGIRSYTPMQTFACIADFSLKKKVEPGIFVGFTKNLGSKQRLADVSEFVNCGDFGPFNALTAGKYEIYDRTYLPNGVDLNTLDYVVGVAPRLKWHKQPVTFAAELRYIQAVYAGLKDGVRVVDCHARPCGPSRQKVDMFRFIASTYYWF